MQSVVPGVGAEVKNALSGERLVIADRGLSRTAGRGALFTARVFAIDDFNMTTGATFQVRDKPALDYIFASLADLAFINSKPFSSYTREEGMALATCLIRANLHVRRLAEETAPAPAGPGGNAPCPCGSGKKYKKCWLA